MDDDGFRDFVRARLSWLSRVAYLLTGDHHAAEDLTQTVLIKLARHWDRVSGIDDPEAYIRRIAEPTPARQLELLDTTTGELQPRTKLPAGVGLLAVRG